MSHSPPAPPPGYVHERHLFADWNVEDRYPFWVLLILANFVALLPLTVTVLLLWLPYQFYLHLGTPLAALPEWELPIGWRVLWGGLIFIGSMLLHEWLHGFALERLGYKAKYAFLKLFLVATIENGRYLTRRDYLIMTLTPILAMTTVGGLSLLFIPPAIGKLLLIALLLNAAASIGDLMVALRVYNAPQNALFADDNGIQVFVPEPTGNGRLDRYS